MKSARITLSATPPNGVIAGVDWASQDHAVCVLDEAGRVLDRFTVDHSAAGLNDLLRRLRRLNVVEVAIERCDGPVVETLLEAEHTVVVISPNQVKNLRSRYGTAGHKDDRFDAYLLADTLRTDRARLHPLVPSSEATLTLRAACRARKDLIEHRIAVCNQLRAHLQHALPGAVGLFSQLDSQTSLRFLSRFDRQERLDWLTPGRLTKWLRTVNYSGRTTPDTLHQRLTAAPRGPVGQTGAAHATITQALVAILTGLANQIAVLTTQIAEQLATHTDAHIFTSLPRSGSVRAAKLLAEIGDCRARFPTPQALASLAGAAPVTKQSGKHRTVHYRVAVDKKLREAIHDFAGDSRHANPWAADLYTRARARGHDHPHAVRILARAWCHVIWHCWQNHTAYDPAQHKALQRLLASQTKIDNHTG